MNYSTKPWVMHLSFQDLPFHLIGLFLVKGISFSPFSWFWSFVNLVELFISICQGRVAFSLFLLLNIHVVLIFLSFDWFGRIYSYNITHFVYSLFSSSFLHVNEFCILLFSPFPPPFSLVYPCEPLFHLVY